MKSMPRLNPRMPSEISPATMMTPESDEPPPPPADEVERGLAPVERGGGRSAAAPARARRPELGLRSAASMLLVVELLVGIEVLVVVAQSTLGLLGSRPGISTLRRWSSRRSVGLMSQPRRPPPALVDADGRASVSRSLRPSRTTNGRVKK